MYVYCTENPRNAKSKLMLGIQLCAPKPMRNPDDKIQQSIPSKEQNSISPSNQPARARRTQDATHPLIVIRNEEKCKAQNNTNCSSPSVSSPPCSSRRPQPRCHHDYSACSSPCCPSPRHPAPDAPQLASQPRTRSRCALLSSCR